MPSVLLLPPRHTDQRIWGGLISALAAKCEVLPYDGQTSDSDTSSFLNDVHQLIPDDGHYSVVVAAERSASLAIDLALAHQTDSIVLLEPTIDAVPEELGLVDFSGPLGSVLEERTRITAPMIDAASDTDISDERWRSIVVGVYREFFGPHLAPEDLALVSHVYGDHAEEVLAEFRERAAAAEAATIKRPQVAWIERLREVEVPMVIVADRAGAPIAEVLAARVPQGHVISANSDTGPVWMTDRSVTVAAVLEMAHRCH